ncbi:hypothetical protein QPK24_04985 [Paenibacillus polygoni]|uniref:Uncharacterized protein n=1 Tax=Paenibacillus polygoni TaxID=3050112 RepID=A0ABY8X4I3_9BACL|nr:hypothetical protein [Paenibacillus polygoni]WIV20074.1 hypothetical protein QPK24_04985 [Paenibacillus polygoni]
MSSSLDVFYTWNREAIPVSGENSLFLLIEWRSGPPAKRQLKTQPKLLFREVELLIKPEKDMQIKTVHGVRAKESDAGWVIGLGNAYKGKTKSFLLEFEVSSQSPGKKPACSAYWSALKTKQDQRILLRREQINLLVSTHFGVIGREPDPRVQKYVILSQSTVIMKQSLRAFERGRSEEGKEIIKRHTDGLLIQAARTGDVEYYREAHILSRLCLYYEQTHEKSCYDPVDVEEEQNLGFQVSYGKDYYDKEAK